MPLYHPQLPSMPPVRIELPEVPHSIEWGAVSDYIVGFATIALFVATWVLARYTRLLVAETKEHRVEHGKAMNALQVEGKANAEASKASAEAAQRSATFAGQSVVGLNKSAGAMEALAYAQRCWITTTELHRKSVTEDGEGRIQTIEIGYENSGRTPANQVSVSSEIVFIYLAGPHSTEVLKMVRKPGPTRTYGVIGSRHPVVLKVPVKFSQTDFRDWELHKIRVEVVGEISYYDVFRPEDRKTCWSVDFVCGQELKYSIKGNYAT